MSLIQSNTPWGRYRADGININVKREDLCCPEPGPSFSKLRGVEAYLLKHAHLHQSIGVIDTEHSKAGWGVAYVCQALGLECHNWYPVFKRDGTIDNHQPRLAQQHSSQLGATMHPMQATRFGMYQRAGKELDVLSNGTGLMLPVGLKLQESVDCTADEVRKHTPLEFTQGTWVVSVSSGTLAAGVVKGLARWDCLGETCIVLHLGYSRSQAAVLKYIEEMSGVTVSYYSVKPCKRGAADTVVVDEGYAYKDKVDVACGFPCNQYYDLKAFKWLSTHAHTLQQPVIFWNIGA